MYKLIEIESSTSVIEHQIFIH